MGTVDDVVSSRHVTLAPSEQIKLEQHTAGRSVLVAPHCCDRSPLAAQFESAGGSSSGGISSSSSTGAGSAVSASVSSPPSSSSTTSSTISSAPSSGTHLTDAPPPAHTYPVQHNMGRSGFSAPHSCARRFAHWPSSSSSKRSWRWRKLWLLLLLLALPLLELARSR